MPRLMALVSCENTARMVSDAENARASACIMEAWGSPSMPTGVLRQVKGQWRMVKAWGFAHTAGH